MSSSRSALILLVAVVAAAGLTGCGLFRSGSATKQRLDEPRELPHHPTNVKPRTMVIEVTTDAGGAVVAIVFRQSSGSGAVDNYEAENIRHTWPSLPSTRTVVQETYSAERGFYDQKVLSSNPVP